MINKKKMPQSLGYSFYKSGHTPPREHPLNGGLYTGEPFRKDAPYRNFPATPDAAYLMHVSLRSANPPTEALYQPPGFIRPGNSAFDIPLPHFKQFSDDTNIFCINGGAIKDVQKKSAFAKYFHI